MSGIDKSWISQLPPHVCKRLGELAQYTSALTAAVKECNPRFVTNMPVPPPEVFRTDHSATQASSSNPSPAANNGDDGIDSNVDLGLWTIYYCYVCATNFIVLFLCFCK